ncbi:hypothetical protein [Planosporangium mesophilum]|uniref:Uncharacterized protein n=1 Tax=Planosporangium mesophilum TaxID=689768 RepID=A0A8J3TFD0_9ACTN|nr:hypothetical protein [Planosporangium mesophilum]NJC86454.1 hypothetical protein [Planosporangium mesophilum]GII26125.1 hypothetical protein Pme01_57220 [Planosporangium mesophilum]
MADPRIETLITQYGLWRFQWREDGRWRQVDANQLDAEAAGEHTPSEDEWVVWTGAAHGVTGRAEAPEGRDEPTWWMHYGEMPAVGTVRVWKSDGTLLPVRTIGRVWVCEWYGVGQPVTIEVGDKQFHVRIPYRRHYLS